MKRCPACTRTYTDDQNFCLDDGTTLVSAPPGSFDSSQTPTADYPYRGGAAPTEFLPGTPTASGRPPYTTPPPQQPPPQQFVTPYEQKRSPAPWIIGGVLLVAIGIGLAVFLSSRSEGTTSSSGGTSTKGAVPTYTPDSSASWETINESGFSIKMPGKPTKNEQSVPSAAGPLPIHLYTLSHGFEGYITGYTEYPDYVFTAAEPEDLLDGAQQGAISNVQGQVTSQRKINIEGNPGREIVGTSPSKNIGFTARVFLVKPRMYMLVYTQFDKDKPISAHGKQFLDSFQITK